MVCKTKLSRTQAGPCQAVQLRNRSNTVHQTWSAPISASLYKLELLLILPEMPRRGSSSSTSPSLLDEIHAQIIEADAAANVQPPIPQRRRSKSPAGLSVVAEATDDDNDENLDALGREIVEDLEEDDDLGMSLNIDNDVDVIGPIKGRKVPETPPKISSVEEAVAAATRQGLTMLTVQQKCLFQEFFK